VDLSQLIMKHFYLIIILVIVAGFYAKAQTPSTPPTGCSGKTGNPSVTIKSGSPSFTFSSLTAFTTSQQSSITLTISSPQSYTLYAAGVVTALAGSSTNTVIPIGTFSVSANGATAVTLSNQYLPITTTTAKTVTTQTITINLNPVGNMDTFQQAPGSHVLTLYFYICN
jgi:hypothetical protein